MPDVLSLPTAPGRAAPARGPLGLPLARRQAHAIGARAAWALVAGLAALLAVPALAVAHIEGFSTAIISLAMHVRDGSIRAFDFIYPANLEYFALSRLGATLGVAALMSVPGVDGTLAFRLLVWGGTLALLGGTWVLVRRWTEAPALLVAAALLVVPAATENAYIYNDNVVSAALGVCALALLVAGRRGLGTAVGAGVLLGLSVVTRADAVLLGPAVLLILAEQEGTDRAALRRALPRAVAFGAGALLPLVGLLGLYGATYLDVLEASTHTVYLWNRSKGLLRQAIQITIFLGLPGLVLAAAGALDLARRRRLMRLALLGGVPALYNLITLGKMWQARQLLPLLPMILSLVVIGWQALAGRRVARGLVAALVALSLVGPPLADVVPGANAAPGAAPRGLAGAVVARVQVYMPPLLRHYDDGPRVLFGRLWNLAEWRRWQDRQNGNQARLRAFAGDLAEPSRAGTTTAVISDEFTADEYTHLALQEAGFRVRPAGAAYPACARVGELWTRGTTRVLHVRLHVPFVTSYQPLISRRLEADGIPCLDAVRPGDAFYVEKRGWAEGVLQRATGTKATGPVTFWPGTGRTDLAARGPHDDAFVVIHADADTFARLRRGFVLGIDNWERWAAPRERHFMTTLPAVDSALSSQVGFPRWEGL